jgi:protein gp37
MSAIANRACRCFGDFAVGTAKAFSIERNTSTDRVGTRRVRHFKPPFIHQCSLQTKYRCRDGASKRIRLLVAHFYLPECGKPVAMAEHSKIEWTDITWNPVRGCTVVSPGCANCYAETFAERFRGVKGHPYEQGFDLKLIPGKLAEPFRWTKPSMVFVNSMSDLFHEDVPEDYIVAVANVMREANWHTYQVLTKRAARMQHLLSTRLRDYALLDHIWWGVSVENRAHGVPRIEMLRTAPAAVRFLSVEPLLEDLGTLCLEGIHWVIAGGESGARARHMKPEWVMSLRDQCRDSGIPFFFKQWGGVQKKKTGRLLDGRTFDEQPLKSMYPMPSRSERLRLVARSFEPQM